MMFRSTPVFAVMLSAGFVAAQDKKEPEHSLGTATGAVEKADKENLTVKPRGADGKYQKTLSLKLTGTSKVTVLTPQKRADRVVLPQREIEAKDLVQGQAIAVIYTESGKDGPVLLSAVAHPVPAK